MSRKRRSFKDRRRKGIKEKVISTLKNAKSTALNYKQIAALIGMTQPNEREAIVKALSDLRASGDIDEVGRGKFIYQASKDYYIGTVDMNSAGNAYIIVEDLDEDIFVTSNRINKAFDGDTVRVYQYRRRRNKKREGEIVEIISRKRMQFVGTIELHDKFAFVRMTESTMYTDFFVPIERTMGAKNGEMVVVELKDWPDNVESPYGTIVQVLGYPGKHETEIHAILAQYGFPVKFPKEVEEYANALDIRITEEEIAKRKDFREHLTFTIDPADAKDFDDALSYRKLENGNHEIGIHIADVSHFVRPGTLLDEEAFERATSVYLVDRTIPMLPEVLSNQACSLRPNEDKYAFSVVFEMDDEAQIQSQWFGKTVIRSNERMAYEEAQYIIEKEEAKDIKIPKRISISNEEREIDTPIAEAILEMDRLAKKLRVRRMNHGAISFDKIEVKFYLDEKDNPTGVYFQESKDANKLIEEFMLLTNRRVSHYVSHLEGKKNFIYRVHDKPNSDKLEALQNIIKRFGYSISFDKGKLSKSLNKLLADVSGKKEQNLIDTLTIRSMSKAEYSSQNIGHYGLAFDFYSHFTSPIRRYPDILAHRMLQQYLNNEHSYKLEEIDEMAKHSSDMEVLATNAERDSVKYMQVKYMSQHQDEEFLGVISGVTHWGVYVEIIDNKCEGMVRIHEIPGDHFVYVKEEFAVQGVNTNMRYQLGDEVYVRVKNVDLTLKHIDFDLIASKE